jgi:AraC family transcriptional regulator
VLRPFESIRQRAWALALGPSNDPQAVLVEGGGCFRALGDGKWHWHDCMVILLPHIGAFSLKHEDLRSGAWVSQNEFMVLPRERAHESHPLRAGHSHTALYMTEDALRGVETEVGSLARLRQRTRVGAIFPMTSQIRGIHGLCREHRESGVCDALAKRHLGAALLLSCLAQVEKSDSVTVAAPGGHGAALVSEMKAFMTGRCSEPIPLDEIAHSFRVSRRHATRLFRRYAGTSIYEFRLRKQIDKARDLLLDTDLAIGEIAYRVGFQSGSALARAMRRLEDKSPTEMRSSAPNLPHRRM